MSALRDAMSQVALGWVKPELDETLRLARAEVEYFAEDPADSARMHLCAGYLHQVQGTLRMVELYAPAMVAEELEQLAQALHDGRVAERDEACATLMRGTVLLPDYLERLQSGHRDIPIVLLPLLNDIRAARGEPGLDESVLFAPDLERPLPPSVPLPETLPWQARQARTAAANEGLERALADWPEHAGAAPRDPAGLAAALKELSVCIEQPAARRMLWVAAAVADALHDGALPASAALRQGFAGVARTARQIQRGEPGATLATNQEPARQLLYQVSQSAAPHPALDELRRTFQLDAAAPSEAELDHARSSISGRNRALLDTVGGVVKEELLRVKDALDLHLRTGAPVSGLQPQVGELGNVADTLGMLGLDAARGVVLQQRDALAGLVAGARQADEGALLDIAGALLYVDASLDDQVARLGTPAGDFAGDDADASDTRQTIEALAKEAIRNFAAAREGFVAFIETNWNHGQLAEVPRLLAEVAGALRILGLAQPADYLEGVRRYVAAELIGKRRVPGGQQLDTLADAMASLEYYLEALREQRPNRDEILDITRGSLEALHYWPLPEAAAETAAATTEAAAPTDAPAATETALALQPFADADADADAGEAPTVQPLELEADAVQLQALEPQRGGFGELTLEGVDPAPFEPADGAIGYDHAAAIDDPVSVSDPVSPVPAQETGAAPDAAASSAPTAEALAPGTLAEPDVVPAPAPALGGFDRGSSDIDDDIREVFLEEFDEEIVNLHGLLAAWRAAPQDMERLRAVRRVFHTLKGSGRLVGASLLGEFSWKIENMLNRVLDGSRPPSDAVLALLAQVEEALPQLNAALRGQPSLRADIEGLKSVADRLAAGEEAYYAAAPALRDENDDAGAGNAAVAGEAEEAAAVFAPETEGTPASVDGVLREILEAEVGHHLEAVQAWLARAERAPQAADDAVLRAFHTMNGAFAMADVPEITEVTGAAEQYLKRLMPTAATVPDEGVAALADGVQAIRRTIAALQGPSPRIPVFAELSARLLQLRDRLPSPPAPAASAGAYVESLPSIAPPLAPAQELSANDLSAFIDAVPDETGILGMDAAEDAVPAEEAPASATPAVAGQTTEAIFAVGDETAIGEVSLAGAAAVGTDAPAADELVADEDIVQVDERAGETAGEFASAEVPVEETAEAMAAAADAPAETRPAASAGSYVDALPAIAPPLAPEASASVPASLGETPPAADSVTYFDVALTYVAKQVDTSLDASPDGAAAQVPEADIASDGTATSAAPFSTGSAAPGPVEALEAGAAVADDAEETDAVEAAAAESGRVPETVEADAAVPPEMPVPEMSVEEASAGYAAAAAAEAGDDASAAMEDEVVADGWPADAAAAEISAEAAADEALVSPAADEAAATPDDAETVADEAGANAAPLADEPAIPAAAEPVEDALDFAALDRDLVDIFVEEGHDLLDHSDGLLAKLRETPEDRELVLDLQRDLHTLKGGARMAGIDAIGDLGHAIESLLEQVAAQRVGLGLDDVRALERGFDNLHDLLARTGAYRATPIPAALIAEFNARAHGTPVAAEPVASAAVVPAALAPLSAPVETDAAPAEAEAPSGPGAQEQVRIRADLLDRLVNYAGEVAIYRSRLEQQLGAFRGAMAELDRTNTRLHDQLRRLDLETEAQIVARYQREQDQHEAAFDPLELDRFSTLQQLSRALAESAADLSGLQGVLDDLARQYDGLLHQQSRVSSELQDGLMRARMVPFDGLVPRLRRVLRQAAAETGKQARLQIDGAHGELDRNVLERMTAPLEHLLRNAVAHGLETPKARRAAGKESEGVVRIVLRREGSEMVLQVSDDGAGIDHAAIRRRAEQRGLIAPGAAIADADLERLILESGFSTYDQVSQLAGRGVGMDVVHNEVRQLGGSLEIASTAGQGTTFTLRLPQTLAVTQAVFVQIGETQFAVPVAAVGGIGRIARERFDVDGGAYLYGGEEYALHDLGLLVGQAPAKAEGQPQVPLLLVRAGDLRAAVAVDQVLGNREIVVKPVGPQIASIPGIYGATITGDGSVVVILDAAPLVRRYVAQPVQPASVAETQEQRRVPLVMVVDDSLTMRKVTGRVLERHNFEVATARDGVEALERLEERIPDLMLLDIEMPRMDGYELAAAMRADARLREVPIVMITSRTGDKHRQRAFDIGVQRYMGKPYQELDLMRNVYDLLGIARARD